MVKVSIIVPIFNTDKYIEKCLNSLVNQTLSDIEIICINDGSTDNSLIIIRRFANRDSRIKILEQQNLKQGAARNNGMRIASGEYIGFVDSDDWIDLDYFEKLYTAAKKYNSDIALATNIRVGRYKQKKRLNIEKEEFVSSLQDKFDICQQWKNECPTNKIYRHEMLKANNIVWPEGCYCEDKLFTVQAVYYANGVVAVPNVNYYYFRNPNSTVNTKKRKHFKQLIQDKNNAKRAVLAFLKEKKAEIRDKDFWAITKSFNVFNFNIFLIKESLKTQKLYLFNFIRLLEWKIENGIDYKHNKVKIFGISIRYKNKEWCKNSVSQNLEMNKKNLELYKINNKKSILFVVANLITAGGCETRLFQYINYLEKSGWNVYILSEKNDCSYLQEKHNFHLNFDAENFHDCLLELVKHYRVNVVEFQFKKSKILKTLDINELKKYARLGCTIHNLYVNKYLNKINSLDYSIIVSQYMYCNHYTNIKNAIVIQNGLDIQDSDTQWKFNNQNTAILVSRIAKDKLKSIECFIKYCRKYGFEFKIARNEYLSDKLTTRLKQTYHLPDDTFIGGVNTREYLKNNIDNILFVGGVGLVILESLFLGIPSFCCSAWWGKNYSFITKDNISLFDNFTIRNSSVVCKKRQKKYNLELNNLDNYDVQKFVFEKRNFKTLFQKYLNIIEGVEDKSIA